MSAPHILVVEDSATQARLLRLILEDEGFTVDVVGDGPAALARLAAAPFDLVVSDVLMPGLTGFELCRTIKADPALVRDPGGAVTTLREPQEIVQALEVGADSFIRKPYEPDALVARLRSLLAQRPPRTQDVTPTPGDAGTTTPASVAWTPSSTARRSTSTRTASRSCACSWERSRTWSARTRCCASARKSFRWPSGISRRRRA